MDGLYSTLYIVCGLLLPLYYVPQIHRCLRDQTRLRAYSMGKSGTQLMLRLLMMPFVFGIGNEVMSFIVAVDLLGRVAEFGSAVWSLHRQGVATRVIVARSLPRLRRSPHKSVVKWDVSSVMVPLDAFGSDALKKPRPAPRAEPEPEALPAAASARTGLAG